MLDLIIDLTSRHFGAWAKLRLLERKYPPTEDLKEGPFWVLRNGGQQFVPLITEEMNRAFAKDPEHLRLLMHFKSYICVPLEAGGRIFGTFSLVGTERSFTEEDLSLAHDLARWIALAVGNARLFSRKTGS